MHQQTRLRLKANLNRFSWTLYSVHKLPRSLLDELSLLNVSWWMWSVNMWLVLSTFWLLSGPLCSHNISWASILSFFLTTALGKCAASLSQRIYTFILGSRDNMSVGCSPWSLKNWKFKYPPVFIPRDNLSERWLTGSHITLITAQSKA